MNRHSDMIDEKDLIQFKASELQFGGIFYRKDPDGFHRCCIDHMEIKNPVVANYLRALTKKFSEEGRLYRRINKPWKGFEA